MIVLAVMLAMVRAMHRVPRWIAATPGAEVARAVAPFCPTVPASLLTAAIARYRTTGLYAVDPVLPREGFARLQQAMLSGGALRQRIAFEDCVDTTLAEKIVAQAL